MTGRFPFQSALHVYVARGLANVVPSLPRILISKQNSPTNWFAETDHA